MNSLCLTLRNFHIWQGNITYLYEKINQFSKDLYFFNNKEMQKFKVIKSSLKKQTFLVSRFCLKNLLSIYLNKPLIEIEIHYLSSGEPYLYLPKTANKIVFSITHSQDYIMIILGINENNRNNIRTYNEIGIDTEKLDLQKNYSLIAKRFFSLQDQLWLKDIDSKYNFYEKEVESLRRFYKIWCFKEAYFKAFGGNWFNILKANYLCLKRNCFTKSLEISNHYYGVIVAKQAFSIEKYFDLSKLLAII